MENFTSTGNKEGNSSGTNSSNSVNNLNSIASGVPTNTTSNKTQSGNTVKGIDMNDLQVRLNQNLNAISQAKGINGANMLAGLNGLNGQVNGMNGVKGMNGLSDELANFKKAPPGDMNDLAAER